MPKVVTFGCRLNSFESEVMRGHAATATDTDNLIIVNTCAVTGEAERQARQAIRKLRRDNPQARIVVTGCAAQVHPDRFAAMAEVDQVVGNADKLQPDLFTAPPPERIHVTDIMTLTETAGHLVAGFSERTRAFVEIQQGCDHRCTFCIIPFGRGNNRSTPIGAVVDQVRQLVAAGHHEVVLTGVNISSYGGDLPGAPPLGQLVRRLLALVPELPRLRLSSLDPADVLNDADLLAVFAEDTRLLPHLHLSVQAGDDLILKRMKRRHSRADVLTLAQRLRTLRPDVALGADLIAGFPTETDAMAQNSLDLVREAGLTHLHVFPFSARAGTPAAQMPKVPGPQVKARAAALRQAGETMMAGLLRAQVGRTETVLVEDGNSGFTPHYLPVRLTTPHAAGSLVTVRLISVEDGVLVAEG